MLIARTIVLPLARTVNRQLTSWWGGLVSFVGSWLASRSPESTYLIDETVRRHTSTTSETLTANGVTYAISNRFTAPGSGHEGSHWHNTSTAGPPAPALATTGRYAEVGGFFGDEEVRGVSEFNVSTMPTTSTQVLLKFTVTDLTVAEGGIDINPLGGLYGQTALTASFDVIGYQANGTEELSDYEAPVITILNSIDSTTLTEGDVISIDITSYYNARRALGDTWIGVRLQLSVSDPDAGALVFQDFLLEVASETVTTVDIPRVAKSVLEFDGVNDQVDLGTAITLSGDFTISFWAKRDTTNTLDIVLGHSVDDAKIGFSADATNLFIRTEDGEGSSTIAHGTESTKWNMYTFTRLGAIRVVYVNGVFKSAYSQAASDSIFNQIGHDESAGFFDGEISDVRILSKALTAAEICALWKATWRPDGDVRGTLHADDLEGWYPLEDGSGTTAHDASGNLNHGTITGATWAEDGSGPASIVNELGYTFDDPVFIPPNASDLTLDALGDALQYTGPLGKHANLIQSPCVTFDGVNDKLVIPGLTGSETVVSSGGTAVPTVGVGEITFTAGTCWDLLLSNGWHYPMSEGSGLTVYNRAYEATPTEFTYLRPDGTSTYLRPDGTSQYVRP